MITSELAANNNCNLKANKGAELQFHLQQVHLPSLQIVVPALPGKAWKRQFPFRGDDGLFEEAFIEERRKGLEGFINKIAGHPLAQNERCLHMFLQEAQIDRNYVPGKIRNT